MFAELNANFSFTHEGVVCTHPHPEAKRNFGKFLSDATKTYDAERFSFNLEAGFSIFFEFFKIATCS